MVLEELLKSDRRNFYKMYVDNAAEVDLLNERITRHYACGRIILMKVILNNPKIREVIEFMDGNGLRVSICGKNLIIGWDN